LITFNYIIKALYFSGAVEDHLDETDRKGSRAQVVRKATEPKSGELPPSAPLEGSPMDKFDSVMRKILSAPKKAVRKE
jgi:hypothetical protein